MQPSTDSPSASTVRYVSPPREFVPSTGAPYRHVPALPTDLRFLEWPDVRDFMGRKVMLSPQRSVDLLHWGSFVEGQLVSAHAVSWSKKKRNDAWGRYINSYWGFTLPEWRFQGHGEALFWHIQREARAAGYDRMKSLIQTIGGVRLHLHLGHSYWGTTEDGMVVVDTPLAPDVSEPATGAPMQVRTRVVGEPHRLGRAELFRILTEPGRFDRSTDEARVLLARYPDLLP